MDNSLITRVRQKTLAERAVDAGELAPAAESRLVFVEQQLGFPLEPLLRQMYGEISHGGFGPGGQVMSVGEVGDACLANESIVETYRAFASQPQPSWEWPEGLMPFLDWGGASYGLIDCATGAVHTFEEDRIWNEGYRIDEFFEIWLAEGDFFPNAIMEELIVDGINPLTGQPMKLSTTIRVENPDEV